MSKWERFKITVGSLYAAVSWIPGFIWCLIFGHDMDYERAINSWTCRRCTMSEDEIAEWKSIGRDKP